MPAPMSPMEITPIFEDVTPLVAIWEINIGGFM